MTVRVRVVLILDVVVALIQGDFVVGSCWIIPFCYEIGFVLWTPSTRINVGFCSDRTSITNT